MSASNTDTSQTDTKKPEALLSLYLTMALVSFAVILSLTGVSIQRIYSQHIINNAEEDAVNISTAILAEEQDFLIAISPTGGPRLEAGKNRLGLFDQNIRNFLQTFNIVKIKIYNIQSEILYSTDPTVIGMVDSGNTRLKNALLGNNDSKLETKDTVIDLAGEGKFDVDVVETYVPVKAVGNVIGSFEIYMDVTKYRAEIKKIVTMSVSILAIILFFVFVPSFLLIRRGTLQVKAAQEELLRNLQVRREIERQQAQEQLEYQASHDALTNLPNRNLLADHIQRALRRAQRHKRQVAVLFIDLDHFSLINDSLGYDVGDRLLKIVAERLTGCVPADDTVARQGEDDFVIVLSDLVESEDAAMVVQKIQLAVNRPVEIDAQELEISCSIGISIYPKDGKDVQTLLKNADAAMFRAKEQGSGTWQFFTDELNDRVVARMTMERCLRRALENDELSVHYQPQVDLAGGRMTGIEALLRWQNPELGMVSPARFIPLAEETGLIIPIGEWVVKTACRQARSWQNSGFPPLTMAVNLSPRQFWYPGLIGIITRILHDSGLEPRYLELEITEGMVMRDVESALAMLQELKGLGVQLSMDDFGTGYSNLSHLKRFPFDKLKMDISFVREVTYDPGSAAIAKTIIAMAHNLNLRVIAEGIETEGQLSYLRAHGCDEMQGFYFSRPIPEVEMEQLLREGRHLSFPNEESTDPEKTLLPVDDGPLVSAAMKRVLGKT